MSITRDLKNLFTSGGSGLMRIVVITVIIFIVENVVDEITALSKGTFFIFDFLAFPGNAMVAVKHAWTFVTYMFLHNGLSHIFFNMLWLYWIGSIFVEYLTSKRLVAVYFMGGICGALLYMLATILFPLHWPMMVGASAGVMAVVISTAMLLPEYPIRLLLLGTIRLKYLALISFVLTSILDLSQNTGGKISHIGGALFGVLFMVQHKRGIDITKPAVAAMDWFLGLFGSGKPHVKVSYSRKMSDDEYNMSKKAHQEKLDAILDKYSKSGYDSLTKAEKEFLFKASGKS